MRSIGICAASAIVLLSACATDQRMQSAGVSAETPLTHDEEIAIHTNTVIDYRMENGDTGRNTYGADGSVEGMYVGRGGRDTDKGTITMKGNNIVCVQWQKWEPSCWADFKMDDGYVAHEQGGKKRNVRFTVAQR